MKITLFAMNGSYAHSSLAIRALDTALRRAGFAENTLVEANLRDRTGGVLEKLVATRGELYSFSCYIWNIDVMLTLARDLRALRPDCRIVLGGPEVSFDTERFTALDFVDTVVTGEGENAIVTLAKAMRAGEPLPRLLAGAPDESFAEQGIHYEKTNPVSPLVYYESSRGCPYSCAFCLSSATVGVRAKSAERTLSDLLEFEAFEAPITVKLVDRTFNFDRERAKRIWRGLQDPAYTKCYHFEISADLLDEESFAVLAGFPKGKVRLEIGLQSTNRETLKAINRHADPAAVLQAAKRLMKMDNLHVHLDLIAGLPHEDMTSLRRSFDEAYFFCHVLQLGFLKLLHGTALREKAAEYGMVAMGAAPYAVLQTNWLSFEELRRLHDMAELLDRLRERGRFARSLDFLLPKLPSPFDFYMDLLTYLQETTGKAVWEISQRDLFTHLAAFGEKLIYPADGATFKALLREDFASFEVRRAPHF